MSFFDKLKKGMQIEGTSKGDTSTAFPKKEKSSARPVASETKTSSKKEIKKADKPLALKKKITPTPSKPVKKEKTKKEVKKTTPISAVEMPPVERFEQPDREEKEVQEFVAAQKAPKESQWLKEEGQLVVDVFRTDGDLIIQSAIAGVRPEELDISVEDDMVVIRGSREKPATKATSYFHQECYWGPFSREVILPVEVDGSRTEATIQDGVLTIRIPILERVKRKKVVVKG